MATLHSIAISARLLTRPKRSAISDSGNVSRPTIRATMPLSRPSWPSLSAHSLLSSGNTALSTWRDM
ncbi:hypothetical protein D3C81_2243550 [compost metagenome]